MFRDRPFTVALIVSTALHLSTVSLFSIGVWFPVEKRTYHRFDIIEEVGANRSEVIYRPRIVGETLELDLPPVDDPLARDRGLTLPPIQAPRIEFGGLERLELEREAIETVTRFEDMSAQGLRKPGLIERSIGQLTTQIRDRNPFRPDPEEDEDPDPLPKHQPVPLGNPAPGFEAYVDWIIGEAGRKTVLPLSIPALRNADPLEWTSPIAYSVRVSPDGKVLEAKLPVGEKSSIATSVGLAILNARFESVSGDREQWGTLFIAPITDRP